MYVCVCAHVGVFAKGSLCRCVYICVYKRELIMIELSIIKAIERKVTPLLKLTLSLYFISIATLIKEHFNVLNEIIES